MEGSVSGRIVVGFECSVAGSAAGRELGPGLWGLGCVLRGRILLPTSIPHPHPVFFLLCFCFSFFFLQGTGNGWICSVLQLL